MGRRKSRVKEDEGKVVKHSGLEEPFSSAPTRNPRYCLYCTNHENERRYIVSTYALYAARKIFDAIVGDKEVEPSPLNHLTVGAGDVDIKSEQIDEILAHNYTAAEEAWELPHPFPGDIESFLTGRRISSALQGETKTTVTKEGKVERAPAKPKVDRSQFITVQSLAEEIGIDPRDARAALRKAKVEKPEGGWLGDEAWAKGIRAVLVEAKKTLKGKK